MLKRITSNIVLAENKYGCNLTCLALEDELIFVDTGLNTEFAKRFRKNMEDEFRLEASTLLVTHAHMDHVLGMDAFSDCEVIAARKGKTRFKRFLETDYTEELINRYEKIFPYFRESLKTAKLRKPSYWVEDKLVLKDGQLVFNVVGGHTCCSSIVYSVKEKVIAAGDLLQVDVYPYFGEPDTDLDSWIKTLTLWENMPLKALVPGHGRAVNRDYLINVKSFFEEMLSKLKRLRAEGVPIEDILYHPELPSGYWPENAERTPAYNRSITNLYNSLNI